MTRDALRDQMAAIAVLGARVCVYVGNPWPTRRCDCKYGADRIGRGSEQGNGCPELRGIYNALAALASEPSTPAPCRCIEGRLYWDADGVPVSRDGGAVASSTACGKWPACAGGEPSDRLRELAAKALPFIECGYVLSGECRRCETCDFRDELRAVLGETPEARCGGSGWLVYTCVCEAVGGWHDDYDFCERKVCPGCGACKPVPEERKTS